MKNSVILTILIFVLAGCATVFKGSDQAISFNSEPEGAQVVIDGIPMGMTPTSLSLKKNKFKTVLFKKDGFHTQSMALGTNYDAIALLNVFWDSSTTDLITGNAYEYAPNSYFVKLREDDEAPKRPANKKTTTPKE